MASLIPGFEYDIFISYRQKDNKHDGWVTEFVDNLKGELESTFKEEISVYFDINPHDGLLETHDVDASLKDKLKCLIFIPIISRTYCDPKSFAWEHEFRAFVESAFQDQFGLKVKLPGGNVANRVLPIQIHDLDTDDKKLVENELGGFLRGIDFIYKEPGVNRPLMANEDHPDNNLNKTFYRNQINKVANAIKEIITGLKNQVREVKETSTGLNKEKPTGKEKQKTKIIAGVLIALTLVVAGYFIIPKLIKPKGQPEKSIAVLPFKLLSDEPDKQYLADGMMDAILLNLSKIKDLRVMSRTSLEQYRNPDKTIPEIGRVLRVEYLLEGSFQKSGDNVRLIVQLIKASKDDHIWSKEYDRNWNDIFTVQSEVAQAIAGELNAVITPEEKQIIEKIPTINMEAYDLLIKAAVLLYGDSIEFERAGELIKKAIELDPNYADAYSMAGMLSLASGVFSGWSGMQEAVMDAMPNIEKALKLDQNNSMAHLLMGLKYEWGDWNYIGAEKEFLRFKELSPNIILSDAISLIGEFYLEMIRVENAIPYFNKLDESVIPGVKEYVIIKALVLSGREQDAYDYINKNLRSFKNANASLGEDYIWMQEYDSARLHLEYAIISEPLNMSNARFQANLALANHKTNKIVQAREIMSKLIEKSKITTAQSPDYFVGWYYSGIGEVDSAFYWLDKAYKNKSAEFIWLKADPVFKNLKGDKRYWDLYERTGHKAYDEYIAGRNK